jgi:hypothetical protein
MLKQQEFPEIWVAAGEGCSFLEKFSYVLSELPSKGILFSEQDRSEITVGVCVLWKHECICTCQSLVLKSHDSFD